MKMKGIAVFLLVGMLFLSHSITAYAQLQPEVTQSIERKVDIGPYWVNVNDITLDLYFENGEACCYSKIRALSGTTKISASFKLERESTSGWVLEKSWSQSSSTNSLSFYQTDAVTSGYNYRFSVTANVTRSGVTETVSTSVENIY